jgi:hypothetical protein
VTGPVRALAVSLVLVAGVAVASPAPASASVCGAVGWINGAAEKVCGVVTHGDKLLNAGKKAASGHLGGAAKALLGGGGGGAGSKAAALVSLAALGTWVIGGAKAALTGMAGALGAATRPRLDTTWFSSTYWRMAGIGAVLTLPFLFAAAVQSLMRSDLGLLARAALGYLPLSLLAVGIAAPLTMLLLAACDEMSAIVSSAAGHSSTHFLAKLGVMTGGLLALARSPFLAFLLGVLIAAAALALWLELLMREAAVYVVVLMLPLAFAALAWPARRVWAARAVEMLVALILSKFAIVAVLALGGAALSGAGGPGGLLTGVVLIVLAAFAPWALVRLLPLSELAAGAAGQLRGGLSRARGTVMAADEGIGRVENWAGAVTAGMRRQADAARHVGAQGSEDRAAAGDELEKLASATDGDGGVTERNARLPEREATPAPEPVLVGVESAARGGDDANHEPSPRDDGSHEPSPRDDGDHTPNGGSSGSIGESPAPAERDPGPWEGLVAARQRRWRTPVLGPAMLDAEPLWELPDESPPPEDESDPRPPEQEPEDGRL